MKMAIQNHDPLLVVQPEEARLDALIAGEFRELLAGLVSKGHRRLVLDLGSVEFIDSSGLGAMVTALKKIGGQGEIRVCCVSKPVQSLFATTRMNKVFKIFDTRQQALQGA